MRSNLTLINGFDWREPYYPGEFVEYYTIRTKSGIQRFRFDEIIDIDDKVLRWRNFNKPDQINELSLDGISLIDKHVRTTVWRPKTCGK